VLTPAPMPVPVPMPALMPASTPVLTPTPTPRVAFSAPALGHSIEPLLLRPELMPVPPIPPLVVSRLSSCISFRHRVRASASVDELHAAPLLSVVHVLTPVCTIAPPLSSNSTAAGRITLRMVFHLATGLTRG